MDDGLRKQIIEWNLRFPVDRWWRRKHGVAFGSSIHRESNFLDQLFEYKEDKLYERFYESEEYKPNIGEWLVKQDIPEEKRFRNIVEEAREQMKDLPDEF